MWHWLCWTLVWIAAFWPLAFGLPWLRDWHQKKKDGRSRFWFVFYVFYFMVVLAAIVLHYNVLGPSERMGSGRAIHGFGVRARFPFTVLERWLLVGLFFSVTAILRASIPPSIFSRQWRSGRYRN